MSTYTTQIIDDADAVLGQKWGYKENSNTLQPGVASPTLQEFIQEYINKWLQSEYNAQFTTEAVQAAQLAASKAQTDIIVS